MAIDLAKVKSMTDWPIPIDIKGLRDFLRLNNYYQSELSKGMEELFHYSIAEKRCIIVDSRNPNNP